MNFETLYQELGTNAETLKALVSGISQAEAQIKPAPDSWSILEVVSHLYDEEVKDFRPRLDVILHHPDQPFPPNDPQAAIKASNYNERDLKEMLGKFLDERTESLAWLRELSETDWETVYTNQYGSMKAGDMLAAWVTHDILHMRQLVELRYAHVLRISAPFAVEYAGGW